MKRLSFISSFLIVTLLFAAGIAMGADVAPETAVLASLAFNAIASTIFYVLTKAGVMPQGVAGNYVGVNPGAGAQSVQVINSDRWRADYLVHQTSERFKNSKLIPDTMRLECAFNNNNGKLTFNTFVGNAQTQTLTERRLDRNDAFVALAWRIGLLKQADGTTNGRILTYPNITVFGAAAAAFLMAFYQGIVRMNIDNKDEVKAFPVGAFLEIPETQQTAGTNYDEYKGFSSGILPCVPNLIIDGDKKNEIEIEFPIYNGWAGATPSAAGSTHYAVLELFGYKALNGSKGA